jgi:hypothetical protein
MGVSRVWTCIILTAAACAASASGSADVRNLTGLPAYPSLTDAAMDPFARTDTLGHWCTHFYAATSDSLDRVEAWYRKVLTGASETDLSHDHSYKNYNSLFGIKLAKGIDSVAVYKVASQAPTSIDLSRCSPPR